MFNTYNMHAPIPGMYVIDIAQHNFPNLVTVHHHAEIFWNSKSCKSDLLWLVGAGNRYWGIVLKFTMLQVKYNP